MFYYLPELYGKGLYMSEQFKFMPNETAEVRFAHPAGIALFSKEQETLQSFLTRLFGEESIPGGTWPSKLKVGGKPLVLTAFKEKKYGGSDCEPVGLLSVLEC